MSGRPRFGRNNRGGRGRGHRNRNAPQSRYINKQNLIPSEQLLEEEAGITEYVSNHEGFSGIIKARYSDFHVNEIDETGEVAKLTETKIPDEFKQKKKVKELPKETTIPEIDQEKWDNILKMLESEEDIKINIEADGKEQRTNLHKRIKDVFGQKVINSTIEIENKKYIQIKKYMKGEKYDERPSWPQDLGEYVHFLLYKETADTMDCIMKIGDSTRISPSAFNYAGIKDRRAKTTQWVSVHKVEPYKLLIKTKWIRNVKIGNLKFKDEPLKLGMLKGNKFRIALRNVVADETIVNKAMESVKSQGFINYYGLQRFGNDKEVPTFDVGIKLLQGKFKEACELILKVKKCDDPTSDLTQAKKVYKETSNAKLACEKLVDTSSSIESKLLRGLAATSANEYVNALESIPRNMRLLYIHSIQSYIWNKAVSKRIKDLGLNPVVGDLVFIDKEKDCLVENELSKDDTEANGSEDSTGVEVKILTEDDIPNYSIYDIVLPLPGYNIIYPENSIKDFYKETLESYELKLSMEQQKVKTYTLSGNYRKILNKPTEVTWSFIKYNDPNDTLIRSDFEEILKHTEPKSKPDGKYTALVLNFHLTASSYATMVLREILKLDTSNRAQTKLNNYHTKETVKEVVKEVSETNLNSLLTDKDKFEAFKKAVFEAEVTEEPLKRKNEDDTPVESKKARIDEDKKDTGIKMQPSLV